MVKSLAQGSCRQRNSLHAESVGHGIGADRNVDFNQLRQRVEPGVRGDGRRQIKRQFRVNHRKAGQKERAAQAGFHLARGNAQHRIASNLGPCPRRSGHSDERRGGILE